MHKLMIVTVSTRPGRKGTVFADWIATHAGADPFWEVVTADLGAIDLPMLDEPEHPRLGNYHNDHTRQWSALVAAADAFVVVTPEYNHGAPPSIINALDYLSVEWAYKPMGFVSYGGVSGGTRSVAMIKSIVTTLKIMPMPEAVSLPMFTSLLDAEGGFAATPQHGRAGDAMLGELKKWSVALKPMRG
jgi:NAD(P)H-dependent FMN reductase